MPTYEYKCKKCGYLFEVSHSMITKHEVSCPQCRSEAKRIITGGSGFIIKGSSSNKLSASHGIKCGKEQTCCGKTTPCETRPCGS
jgi:putative FmdB family regulatory protein